MKRPVYIKVKVSLSFRDHPVIQFNCKVSQNLKNVGLKNFECI